MNKSSVLRAIKAGKISATKDEHGEWCIEAAELHRVYPPVAGNGAGNSPRTDTQHPDATLALRAELAEQRLADLKTALEEAREDLCRWRDMAERLSLPKPAEPRAWWWRRLVG